MARGARSGCNRRVNWTLVLLAICLLLNFGLLVVGIALLIVHPPFTGDRRRRHLVRRSLPRPRHVIVITGILYASVLLGLGAAYLDWPSLGKVVGFVGLAALTGRQITGIRRTIQFNRAMRYSP